jgi:3-phenylpropionate/trans-cinnamate dioxygenase ferredoxin reductase subunit
MNQPVFVVVGGGLAAAKLAEALRDQQFDGQIIVVGGESYLPYDRPPLTKGFLAGKKKLADFTLQPQDWYASNNIDLRLSTQVESIDRAAKTVALSDGTILSYDKLALATGSRSKRPPIPGSDAEGVYYLRSYDDAEAMSERLTSGSRLAIVGAGWIGLEVAAQARSRGAEVSIVEGAPTPLNAALGPELGKVFGDLHVSKGVDLRTDASVSAITVTDGVATGLELKDGTTIAANTVLVAVGAAPNIELAKAAGLDTDSGVLVDESLVTSDPDIVAVGDIAEHLHPVLNRRVRVEHWANALNQPATAAKAMLGNPEPYERQPYFYTDQYELGMEYTGLAEAGQYEQVVIRGDLAKLEFIAFWLDSQNRVIAGMNVNVWDVTDDIKELINSARPVDPARLGDPNTALTAV